MVRKHLLSLIVAVALALSGQLVRAHHSETAEYDSTKPVKVTGKISGVEWQNPHVWFFVNVTEADGKVTTWGFSTQPPGALMRRGITKAALVIGAEVNVEGVRARDGSNNAAARRVTFPDGRNVLTGPAA